MSTANVKSHLIDHMAISDLLNRYTDAVNHRDWKALEACFSETGIWDMGGPAIGPGAMYFEGAANVAAGIGAAVSTAEMCFQANHAAVIEVDGDRATARSSVHETVRPAAGSGLVIFGIYYDDLRRHSDGEWRFDKRAFRITYMDQTPLAGHVLATFPRAAI
jgi:hypothetical protein